MLHTVRRQHHERLSDRADRIAEHAPTFTMDRQIAEARAEMGEEAWARLNADWYSLEEQS